MGKPAQQLKEDAPKGNVVNMATAAVFKTLDSIATGLVSVHGIIAQIGKDIVAGKIAPATIGLWIVKQTDSARANMVYRQVQNSVRVASQGKDGVSKVALSKDKKTGEYRLGKPQDRSTSRQAGSKDAAEGAAAKDAVMGRKVTPEAVLAWIHNYMKDRAGLKEGQAFIASLSELCGKFKPAAEPEVQQ